MSAATRACMLQSLAQLSSALVQFTLVQHERSDARLHATEFSFLYSSGLSFSSSMYYEKLVGQMRKQKK
jgi:hypothetical protein